MTDGKDTIYHNQQAKAAFEKGKSDITSQRTFPNPLDISVEQTDVIAVRQTNSLKQSSKQRLDFRKQLSSDVLQMTDNENGITSPS